MGKKASTKKATTKKTTAKKTTAKGALLELSAVPTAGEETPEQGYTLVQAAKILGEPDASLELVLRETHSEEELQAMGAKVGSDRIVEDGERLCSGALLLLQSKDPEIKQACTSAGLTPELVTLLVHALLRLDGMTRTSGQASASKKVSQEVLQAAFDAALAEGKRLRMEIRDRLERVARLDTSVAAQLGQGSVLPTSTGGLASQLDTLASLVDGAVQHKEPRVQGLARLRGLRSQDAEALRQVAGRLRELAQHRGSEGRPKAAERQANLDVQDGYCLVLLSELLGAWRGVARRSRKVQRPMLYQLRSYFQGQSRNSTGENEPSPPS